MITNQIYGTTVLRYQRARVQSLNILSQECLTTVSTSCWVLGHVDGNNGLAFPRWDICSVTRRRRVTTFAGASLYVVAVDITRSDQLSQNTCCVMHPRVYLCPFFDRPYSQARHHFRIRDHVHNSRPCQRTELSVPSCCSFSSSF